MKFNLVFLGLAVFATVSHAQPTPGSAGIPIPRNPAVFCPTYPPGQYDLDSCILSEQTEEGVCGNRTFTVQVPAVSDGLSVNGYPGATGTWACDCDALFTNVGHKDVFACTACKVCNKLQVTGYPISHFSCNATVGCQLPYPGKETQYFVNCGLSGAYVQSGVVDVPPDVLMSIKDIKC